MNDAQRDLIAKTVANTVTGIWVGAPIAALTGKLAETALAPGLSTGAATAVAVHGDWAFFAVVLLVGVFALRFDLLWRQRDEVIPRVTRLRLVALAAGFVAAFVVLTTAARGGELVYRFGVGVEGRRPIPESEVKP